MPSIFEIINQHNLLKKMKKIYTTIAMMLAVTFAFAQNAPMNAPVKGVQLKTERNAVECQQVKKDYTKSLEKGGPAEWIFSYSSTIPYSEFSNPVMIHDTNVLANYSNGAAKVQMNGWAQVYDFTHSHWLAAYFAEQTEYNIPDVTAEGTVYSVDSVGVTYVYQRIANNTDVDTLIITVAAAEPLTYSNIYTIPEGDTTYWFTIPFLSIDFPNANLGQTFGDNETFAIREQIKVPLTIEDTTGNYFVTSMVALENFQNITAKQLAVAFSFKSGKANITANDTLGYYSDAAFAAGAPMYDRGQINVMMPFIAENENDLTWETAGALSETNSALCIMEWSYQDPTSIFYGSYMLSSVWIDENELAAGYTPDTYLRISCDDCPYMGEEIPGSVAEFKNNIVVRPNPATNFFVVELGNTESQVELYNLVGQRVYSETTANASTTINTNNLKAGVYMLRVVQNGAVHTSKVVIN